MKEVSKVDFFIPNESEAETIAGRPVRTLDEARDCARQLVQCGIPRVILTLGANGVLLATPDTMELIPAFSVETRDTTGAGDAFIGSFATFLAEGLPEREALSRACLYAALSTTKVGTQKSFATRSDFESYRSKL